MNFVAMFSFFLLLYVCRKSRKSKKKPKPTNGCFEMKALSEMNVECGKWKREREIELESDSKK